jgi:hypothetical protein
LDGDREHHSDGDHRDDREQAVRIDWPEHSAALSCHDPFHGAQQLSISITTTVDLYGVISGKWGAGRVVSDLHGG